MRHGRDGRRLVVANKVSGEGGRREPLEPVLEEAAGGEVAGEVSDGGG